MIRDASPAARRFDARDRRRGVDRRRSIRGVNPQFFCSTETVAGWSQATVATVDLKNQVISGLRWSAGVRLLSQFFTWAVTLIVVRLLTPADYGLLAMAMVFVGFLYRLAELGLGSAVVQRTEIDTPLLRKAFGLILLSMLRCSCCSSSRTADQLIHG